MKEFFVEVKGSLLSQSRGFPGDSTGQKAIVRETSELKDQMGFWKAQEL